MNRQSLKSFLKMLPAQERMKLNEALRKLPVRAVFEGTSLKELWDITSEISKENNSKHLTTN